MSDCSTQPNKLRGVAFYMPPKKKPPKHPFDASKTNWSAPRTISGKPQPKLKGHAQKPRKGHNL